MVYFKLKSLGDDGTYAHGFMGKSKTTASFQMDASDLNTGLYLGLMKYYIQRASFFTCILKNVDVYRI